MTASPLPAQGPGRPALAFFVQDLRGGGAERSVVRLANGVAARGLATDLVLLKRTGDFVAEVSPAVRIVTLDRPRVSQSIRALARYMSTARPAAFVSHMTHSNVAAVAARALARWKPRLIVVEHNRFDVALARKRGLARLAYRAVPLMYRRADVVAGVADGMRARLAEVTGLPPARIAALFNPVVSADLDALAAAAPAHSWFGDGGPPVILGVGRLTRQKNFPLLLDAFARVRAARPARLVILGEGEERAALERQVAALGLSDAVALPGFLPNPFAMMARAGVFALSSDWEGLPTVLIEAMACGVPIVSTDCESGPAEILDGGRYGRLVPPGDVEAFAAGLLAALAEPPAPETLRARASLYDTDHAVDRYLEAAGLADGMARA